jgi:ribonuclease HI
MLGTPNRRGGTYRKPPRSDLQICWANVAKSAPCHTTLLQTAFSEGIDVVCVQEPFTFNGTKTQNHPAYECYAPVDSWETDPTHPNNTFADIRPRVMTYVRKGAGLKTQQRRSVQNRDLLWTEVNGHLVLNAYRQPATPQTIEYVANLSPPPNCLVGGDFNCTHDMFEPGAEPGRMGGQLAHWATASGMDFIGTPGDPTHRLGHVLDLTFSNIPFARTVVREDMHSGSDHETQVTTLPTRGHTPLEQYHYRVPEAELGRFSGLVEVGIARLPNPLTLNTTAQLDDYTRCLTEVFDSAVKTAGKPNREEGKAAPWWTPECQEAYSQHLANRRGQENGPSTRHFLATVRKAKQQYWRHIIDGVDSDQKLYNVIKWHQMAPNLKAPPLEVNGAIIEDTLEKAEALRTSILGRFNSEDDLEYNPLENWEGAGNLPWNTHISIEEVERNCVGVSSTSPGTDRVTVRLLKACWTAVKHQVHGLYTRCLQLTHFPEQWCTAEVVMLPKVGKKDKTSPRSWRPIALLSCLSKGLERIVARRIAWTALTAGLLSPQHGGALPKRSAMDLAAAFTHDVEAAFAAGQQVTMCTLDVMGAFDALLRRRLLHRMSQQGWQQPCLKFIDSFLARRVVQVRLEGTTTPSHPVDCGTPQGSPLSPVLYMLYLAELLQQDTKLRFGYADDICIYRASHSLETNVELLAQDIRGILDWGDQNRVAFAPEKLEMIHLTRKKDTQNPPCVVNDALTITPIPTKDELPAPQPGEALPKQPALRWLGVWFDRKLGFRRHVSERATKARRIAYHIRGLARTVDGPPAASLRKAVITCVLPSLLYGTEAWYGGRYKTGKQTRQDRRPLVSTRLGTHVDMIDGTLALAARGVLPVWRTTPIVTLFRDAGLPSAMAALEDAKIRFATRLQTVDDAHPLVRRILPPLRARGRQAGSRQRTVTKVQMLGSILPPVPRPKLTPPHFSEGCRTDPTEGVRKEAAAKAFIQWWDALPPDDVLVFSDGSEQYKEHEKLVGYGYAIYQGKRQLTTGYGPINPTSHVFDAEAIGAWKGLYRTIKMAPEVSNRRIWMCIDSTSVLWCMRGNAAPTSQWAFLNCQGIMQTHDIHYKWSPGHSGIEGNEVADRMADKGAKQTPPDRGPESKPTISGISSIARTLRKQAKDDWWHQKSSKLSQAYKQWEPLYEVKPLRELSLPRPILHRYLAIRTTHGDFAWYHTKFNHQEAELNCSCGRAKTPDHLARCPSVHKLFFQWPREIRPQFPPSTRKEAASLLRDLLAAPEHFEEFLRVTEFYSKICTR